MDPELIGAARMLGANERQVFFEIVLPFQCPIFLQDFRLQ